MAIGRTEDRDTPWNPVVLRHREYVRDPIRATHLGQRSIRPHTKAGHMTAIDQTHRSCTKSLQSGGRPHMGSGPAAARHPGMTGLSVQSPSQPDQLDLDQRTLSEALVEAAAQYPARDVA